MQPLCQISKKLYGKSTPCNNLSTALRHKTCHTDIQHIVESTEVRNSISNIHLPLMIFIRMHSQESQFHNKCLFCSMKFIFISKHFSIHWRGMFNSSKNIWCFCREPHEFTEILIINVDENTSVMHGLTLLLNATAVSDFKKALRKKQTMQ